MWPSVQPSVPITETVIATIDDLRKRAKSVGNANDRESLMHDYHGYVDQALTSLRRMFDPADVEQLIRSQTYWATLEANPTYRPVEHTVRAEVEAISTRLGQLHTDLVNFRRHWSWAGKAIVVDTNVFVEHQHPFEQIDWFTVLDTRPNRQITLVVPLIIIDELDSLKTKASTQPKKTRARTTLRTIENLVFGTERVQLAQVDGRLAGSVSLEVVPEPARHVRLPNADAEIVDFAVRLAILLDHNVTLAIASNDTSMLFRTRHAGLEGIRITPIQVPDE